MESRGLNTFLPFLYTACNCELLKYSSDTLVLTENSTLNLGILLFQEKKNRYFSK